MFDEDLTYDTIRNAVCANILCNPTGQEGKFRGIDWIVEHNNLYIKVS